MKPENVIIIARDWDEAEIISRTDEAKLYKILTLTPAATAALSEDKSIESINTTNVYGDSAHIESINNQLLVRDEFTRHAKSLGALSDIQIEAAAGILFYISGASSFFYYTLKKYDEFYIITQGRLEKITGWENAFTKIISGILAKRYGNREHIPSALHIKLMQCYNNYVVKQMAGKKVQLIIDGGRPSSRGLARETLRQDPDLAVLLAKRPAKNIYTALRHMLRSVKLIKEEEFLGKRIPMFFFYPAANRSYAPDLEKIISLCENEFSKLTLQVAKQHLVESFYISKGYEDKNKHQIEILKPEIVSTDAISSGFSISLCKYAKEQGAKVVLFNHASHTAQTGTSALIGNLWASGGVVYSPEATHLALRSPGLVKLVGEISNQEKIILPVRHDKKLPPQTNRDKFRILFAGNYLGVSEHVPWMLETPDEFIQGIAELAEAVSQITDAELIIRVKARKKEFTPEIIAKFIPDYPNVKISNQGTMKEALAEADLMVASISTTIDEALASGRPVLLHSGPKRYQHLPVNPNGRSAIYHSTKNIDLVNLLKEIIAKHKNKPLTDEELSPYIWGEAENDMSGLAKRILEN